MPELPMQMRLAKMAMVTTWEQEVGLDKSHNEQKLDKSTDGSTISNGDDKNCKLTQK